MNVLQFLLSEGMVNDNDVLIDPTNPIAFEFDYFTIEDETDLTNKFVNEELIRLSAKYLSKNSSLAKEFNVKNVNYPIDQQIIDIWNNNKP